MGGVTAPRHPARARRADPAQTALDGAKSAARLVPKHRPNLERDAQRHENVRATEELIRRSMRAASSCL